MNIQSFLEKFGLSSSADEHDEELDEREELPQEEDKGKTIDTPPPSYIGRKNHTEPNKVIDITESKAHIRENSSRVADSMPNFKVVVIQPQSLDDSQQIANCLKEKRPVVINFENVDDQLYRRILDFVSGTVYALEGNANSISNRVWLFSPQNVNVAMNQQNKKTNVDMPWEKKND